MDVGYLRCHTSTPELSLYANTLVAGRTVMEDVSKAHRAFDTIRMEKDTKEERSLNPVNPAKVEKVIPDGKMPQAKYCLMHWGVSFNDTKREVALSWIKNYHMGLYTDVVVAPDFINESICPIADLISVDTRRVASRNLLYRDTRLPADNTVSCVSRHGLDIGGVDNKQYPEGVGDQLDGVNAPTAYNVAYNFIQFWDGRVGAPAEQAAGPPLNPVEIVHKSPDRIISKLVKDRNFIAALGEVYSDGLSEESTTNATQELEKTLLAPSSHFDRYLKGQKDVVTVDEIARCDLFRKYDRVTCYTKEILGGQSYELIGVQHDCSADRRVEMTEEDNGRFKQTKTERDHHRPKVLGLKNIELVAPYFHDDSMAIMDDVVRATAKYQLGIGLPQPGVDKTVAFLRILTGEYKGRLLTSKNMI